MVALPSRVTKKVLNTVLLPQIEDEADAIDLVISLNTQREWFPSYTVSVTDPEADNSEIFLQAVEAVDRADEAS